MHDSRDRHLNLASGLRHPDGWARSPILGAAVMKRHSQVIAAHSVFSACAVTARAAQTAAAAPAWQPRRVPPLDRIGLRQPQRPPDASVTSSAAPDPVRTESMSAATTRGSVGRVRRGRRSRSMAAITEVQGLADSRLAARSAARMVARAIASRPARRRMSAARASDATRLSAGFIVSP
jgi:hypothetical protein